MTLQEALKAMQTHRVRHRYFDKEEWVTKCTNGLYYFEDGITSQKKNSCCGQINHTLKKDGR